MTTDAKLDGRVRELDAALASEDVFKVTSAFRNAWRTWLRDAALRGLDPKGGQDLPLASDDASGVGTGAIASSVERSPASPAGLDPKLEGESGITFAWLLEAATDNGPPDFYDGSGWHPDANLAVRFARREDAERFLKANHQPETLISMNPKVLHLGTIQVREHSWMGLDPKPTEQGWAGWVSEAMTLLGNVENCVGPVWRDEIRSLLNRAPLEPTTKIAAAPSAAGRESEGRLKDAGPESNVPPPAPLSDLSSAVREAAAKVNYMRYPLLDKRFSHGDDFAGDAWVRWVAVGHNPNSIPLPPMSADVQEAVRLAKEAVRSGSMCSCDEYWTSSREGTIARALLKLTSAQRGKD